MTAATLARELVEHVHAWQAAGRPADAALHIRVFARPTSQQPAADEIAIDQRWSRFILGWR